MKSSAISLFSFLFLLIASNASADIEPSLEDLLPVYFITDIQGLRNVQILKDGDNEWRRAKEGERLEEGDRILVGDDTEIILSLKGETWVHLDENTELWVSQLNENQTGGFLSRLKLLTGAILSDVKKDLSASNSTFELDAGGVVCGVRGTIFETSINGDNVQTATEEGLVQVTTSRGSGQVGAGNTCSASKGRSPLIHPSTEGTKTRFQTWRRIRQNLREKRSKKSKSGAGENRLGPHTLTSSSSHRSKAGKSPTLQGKTGARR